MTEHEYRMRGLKKVAQGGALVGAAMGLGASIFVGGPVVLGVLGAVVGTTSATAATIGALGAQRFFKYFEKDE